MLEVKNLSKVYKTKGSVNVKALDNISLRFPETGMVFLLGKSGSGKSTLLNVCGGLDSPTDGEIIVKGRSSKTFTQSDFDSYRNTYIGFIFQEYNVLDEFSVEDNLALALELQGNPKDKERVEQVLKDVDLEGYAKRKPNTLSGGQKQRIAIARALIKSPEIIMADEPTGALDSETGRQIFDTLKKLSKDKLILVVSHDREFAEKYGDRIIELKDGKVISDVSKQEEAFFKTAEEKIVNKEYAEEEKRFVRSKLPVRHAVKIGVSGLKAKPIRLVFTLLLCTFTFIVFGLFSTLTFYDSSSAFYETLRDSHLSTVQIDKYYRKQTKTYAYGILQEEYTSSGIGYFSEEDLARYGEIFGSGVFGGYATDGELFDVRKECAYWLNIFSAFAYLPENHILRDKIIFGRYPEADGEICVSSYLAEAMINRQLKLSNNEFLTATNIQDVLNKEFAISIKNYKIVGIIENESIPSKYDSLKNVTDRNYHQLGLYQELRDYLMDGVYLVGFVTKNDCLEMVNNQKSQASFQLYEKNTLCYAVNRDDNGEYQFGNSYHVNGKFAAYLQLHDSPDVTFFESGKTQMTDNEVLIPANKLFSRLDYTRTIAEQAQRDYINESNGFGSYKRSDFSAKLLGITNNFAQADALVWQWEDNLLRGEPMEIPQQGDEDYEIYQEWKVAVQSLLELYKKYDFYTQFHKLIESLSRNGEYVTIDGNTFLIPYEPEERAVLVKEFLKFLKQEDFNKQLKIKLCEANSETAYGDVEIYDIVGVYGLYEWESGISSTFVFSETESARLLGIQKANVSYYEEITAQYKTNDSEIYDALFLTYDHSDSTTKAFVDIWKNTMNYNESGVRFSLSSSLVDEFDLVNDMVNRLSDIFLYIGLIFTVFSALLLSNFISVSISQKKKDIGILRALGARGVDVFKIFFSESFVLTLICVVISLVGSIGVCGIVNAYMMSTIGAAIFIFGIWSVLVLIGIALITVFVATVVPVYLAAKKKPVESIRAL